MRRALLLPIVALALTAMATSPVAARAPVALGVTSQTSTDMATLDAFTVAVGAKPATWTLWSTWGERGGMPTCVRNVGSCAFPMAVARQLRARRVTPFIWWQPSDPANPTAGTYERYQNIIKGAHDAYIRTWAKDAKKFGKPVIVRFMHEMNGDWFPWSMGNFDNNPKRFKKAWQHVVRIFRQVGARNVKFVWSPYSWGKGSYSVFYPGNDWVDYVGVTSLNWGGSRWKPLTGLLERPMGSLRKITRTRSNPKGKPVILPEVGSNWDGDKAGWIQTGYRQAYKRWPVIRAMVYFDYDTTGVGQPDWRLVLPPDGAAIAAYRSVAAKKIFQASIP